MRARLDGLKSRLRAKDDELGRKGLEMEGLARSLREAKAENKRLQAELDKGSEAKAKIERLKADLAKEQGQSAALTDYYNMTEPQMEALRQEVGRAEAKAQRLAREAATTAASAKAACRTLRLALNDMGAKARGIPGENASTLELCEWNQEAGCVVSDCATAYGDCCARVSAAFALGLLQQHGCEHVAQFLDFAKGDCEVSAQDISPALRAWRRQFWQKDGRSAAKARLLEQLAKTEAADQGEEPAERGGGGAEDHPEGRCRKLCVRPPFGDWRSRNEKFIVAKYLPKVRYLLRPVYREMTINGHNYKVVNVANCMRTHPRRPLEDYDRFHVARLEGMARFWRNHRRTDRQEAIAQRRYALSVVSPPSPLRVVYNISSDDEPSSPDHRLVSVEEHERAELGWPCGSCSDGPKDRQHFVWPSAFRCPLEPFLECLQDLAICAFGRAIRLWVRDR
uniref:Uncharacterized protein n=1 Tax=Oryza punctata TaxID=4537 RepID=A0A0E0LBM1_ORYPU